MPASEMLALRPTAIILSGGPASVYAAWRRRPRPAGLFDVRGPGPRHLLRHQVMVRARRHGRADRQPLSTARTLLVAAAEPEARAACVVRPRSPVRQQVWMSHGDTSTAAPPEFAVTARTAATPAAAVENPDRGLYGVQFHPEVLHTEHGTQVLRRFLEAAGCPPRGRC